VAKLALISVILEMSRGLTGVLRNGLVHGAYMGLGRVLGPVDYESFVGAEMGEVLNETVFGALSGNLAAVEVPRFLLIPRRLRQVDSILIPMNAGGTDAY
jgi:hypothetical protein